MGFKRVLLERSQNPANIFEGRYQVMDLSENMKLINGAAVAVAVPGSMKQFSDFSINKILNSNSDSDEIGDYRGVAKSSEKVPPTGMDLSSHGGSVVSGAPIIDPRPLLNRVFDSPWCSKGPIVFTPKINTLNHHFESSFKQTLITAQSYSYNFSSMDNHTGNPAVPDIGNLGHILYQSMCRNGELLKRDKSDLNVPRMAVARDLDYYYVPNTSSGLLSSQQRQIHQLAAVEPLSAYTCPCKQCELRSLSLTPAAASPLGDDPASSAALFNFRARYECDECGKKFSQLRNYKYHVSIHKGTKEFAAHCPECGKMFNDKGYLSSHLKIHRNRKEYVCPHCPKSFNQRVAFNMHVRIHTGIKPHKCAECGKRFSRKMLLKQHLRTHSGEKPYQCTICLKTFADRSNMTLHQRLHSGIKPFSCPICPKAFTKKHHLKTHLNYHTGFKPYKCPHKDCGQCFTQSSNMRTHAKKCQFKPPEAPSSSSVAGPT